jgi:hypothetical protein
LDKLVELKEKYDCFLMIDECHALGAVGPNGLGTMDHFNLKGKVDLVTGTLAKSLCSSGGYICFSDRLYELLSCASVTVFSVPCSTISASVACKALDLLRSTDISKKLRHNSARWRKGLKELGLEITGNDHSPITCIMVRNMELGLSLVKDLAQHGLMIAGIPSPAVPQGQERLRSTVISSMTDDIIQKALDIMKTVILERYPFLVKDVKSVQHPPLPTTESSSLLKSVINTNNKPENSLITNLQTNQVVPASKIAITTNHKPETLSITNLQTKQVASASKTVINSNYMLDNPSMTNLQTNQVVSASKIAITGMALRLGNNINSLSAFRELLKSHRNLATDVPSSHWSSDWSASKITRASFLGNPYDFDCLHFNISPREAAEMDPQQRWLLELTVEAIGTQLYFRFLSAIKKMVYFIRKFIDFAKGIGWDEHWSVYRSHRCLRILFRQL